MYGKDLHTYIADRAQIDTQQGSLYVLKYEV